MRNLLLLCLVMSHAWGMEKKNSHESDSEEQENFDDSLEMPYNSYTPQKKYPKKSDSQNETGEKQYENYRESGNSFESMKYDPPQYKPHPISKEQQKNSYREAIQSVKNGEYENYEPDMRRFKEGAITLLQELQLFVQKNPPEDLKKCAEKLINQLKSILQNNGE